MKVIIDDESYGERTAFKSLADAQAAIRALGGDLTETVLSAASGGTRVADERGEIIGRIVAEDLS